MTTPDALFKAHIHQVSALYDKALAATPFDAAVIGAGFPHRQFLDDRDDPYVPNPHFKYWVPLAQAPGSFVVLKPQSKPKLLFLQPEDYWHKPPETPTEPWVNEFDLIPIRSLAEARQHVPANAVFIGEAFHTQDTFGFAGSNPAGFIAQVHYARARKTPYEILCLQKANEIASRGHQAALTAFNEGLSEYATHLRYLAATAHMEAELPYSNIIAHNDAAGILHYTDLRRQTPSPLRNLLIDAGGQYRGYAADITRTHSNDMGLYGELKAEVDALERELCEMVTPGRLYTDIHLRAHFLIAQTLERLKILHCSAESAVERGITSVFFPHGIGHLLGLQVHDIGGHQTAADGTITAPPTGHPFLRLTRVLEESCVVTIEPGIYFIPMLLKQAHQKGFAAELNHQLIDTLLPFGGVRVEDNVMATSAGAVNLTRQVLPF